MASLPVEVIFIAEQSQFHKSLQIEPPGDVTIRGAIQASGLLKQFPELMLEELTVGVFGKKFSLDHMLEAGDRVEVYRPLIIDPKEARRQRARKKQP